MIDVYRKINECQVMAEANDIIVHSLMFEYMHNDTNLNVLELGAGSGGWTRIMHSLGIHNVNWILLEDFRWADVDYDTGDFVWPTNRDELILFIEHVYPNIVIDTVIDNTVDAAIENNLLDKYKNNVSVMRIDCDISVDAANYLINEILDDNGIVIIDDCRINCGLQRILLGTNLVTHGKLHPIWFGEKEAMYSKNYELSRELQNFVYDKITNKKYNDLYVRREYAIVEGKQWNNICTTKFPVS